MAKDPLVAESGFCTSLQQQLSSNAKVPVKDRLLSQCTLILLPAKHDSNSAVAAELASDSSMKDGSMSQLKDFRNRSPSQGNHIMGCIFTEAEMVMLLEPTSLNKHNQSRSKSSLFQACEPDTCKWKSNFFQAGILSGLKAAKQTLALSPAAPDGPAMTI